MLSSTDSLAGFRLEIAGSAGDLDDSLEAGGGGLHAHLAQQPGQGLVAPTLVRIKVACGLAARRRWKTGREALDPLLNLQSLVN